MNGLLMAIEYEAEFQDYVAEVCSYGDYGIISFLNRKQWLKFQNVAI